MRPDVDSGKAHELLSLHDDVCGTMALRRRYTTGAMRRWKTTGPRAGRRTKEHASGERHRTLATIELIICRGFQRRRHASQKSRHYRPHRPQLASELSERILIREKV